ncbi:hypothetical protein C2W62_00310 [Candidatus Entotheonella serta]|nr:hypothetical protein C2W62_00310 [Candidatus Entotheonella serta]
MDFRITEEHRRLQERCKQLAADFATRAAEHDRDASHPLENYDILRREGFYALNVPKDWGGSGVGLLGHTLAFEALAQGCQATALAFNMHLSIIGPLMESPEVSQAVKRRVADLVVRPRNLGVSAARAAVMTSMDAKCSPPCYLPPTTWPRLSIRMRRPRRQRACWCSFPKTHPDAMSMPIGIPWACGLPAVIH